MANNFLPQDYRPNPLRTVLFCVAVALTTWLFISFGSDSNVAQEPRSIFHWISMQWVSTNENFKHNWVMLLIAALAIWLKREQLCSQEARPSWVGTLVVAGSLLLHYFSFRSQLPRLSLAACVGVYWGIPYALWGWKTARLLLFPACYTLLCFCGSLLVEVTMPLRLIASELACGLLHGIGIAAVRRGTVVLSSAGGGFQFDVADACSGLRSLVVMTALAAPYAYFTLRGNGKRLLLFCLSVPLAMLANALRIFTLGMVAEFIGMNLAMQLYHDLSGLITFAIAILLLTATASLINRNWKETLCTLLPKKSHQA